MKPQLPTVYIVDDDDAVREALSALLGSVRLRHQSFASAEAFLAIAKPTMRGCLLLDVRMPGMAADFIEKPFNEQDLLDRIQACLKEDHQLWRTRQELDEAAARFCSLTPREQAVMELIAAGNHTKKIAAKLEIQDRTVDVHRFNIMRKVGVRTLAELLHLWSVARQPIHH